MYEQILKNIAGGLLNRLEVDINLGPSHLLMMTYTRYRCCSCLTDLKFAGNFGGTPALIAVLNWYPSYTGIKIKVDKLVVV